MITLTPSVQEFPEVTRALLDLADSIYHVNTTSDTPSLGLVVPEYLYDRYQQYLATEPETSLPVRKKRSKQ
jgi:hypothetical protein